MSTVHKLNYCELKAMRQSLGLTVADAAELIISPRSGKPVTKRIFQYWEAGSNEVPDNVTTQFYDLAVQYKLALHCLERDIADYKAKTYPVTDDSDEYFAKKGKPLALPFFHNFELWQEKTGNKLNHFWRIYQSVVGHLLLVGSFNCLDDKADIPADFSLWNWLNMKYDVSDLGDDI